MSTPPPSQGGPKGPGKPSGPLAALHGKPHVAIALGGAAVVVVVALVKKSSGSSSASTDTTGTSTTGTSTYDSTSNDVYNSIESQLEGFQTQLNQIQSGLPSGTGSTTTGGASAPGGGTTTSPPPRPPIQGGNPPRQGNPVPVKTKKPLFSWVTVSKGQTLSGIAKSHGESLQTLLADNPVYKNNAKYKGGNLIFSGDKVKVR